MKTPERVEKYENWMRLALDEARIAAGKDEVPVGALVIQGDQIVARAHNLREAQQSPSAHAELLALQEASQRLGSWRLVDCVLVTTLEPCVMCAGALIQARIKTLVYGASDPKGGAESVFGVLSNNKHNHTVDVVSGILDADCGLVLKEFFKAKRTF
jgi:tRNA(adenine34) deaminase